MKFTVRVPATSANLGPGFDSFGLALQLYNDVTIDTDAEPGVTWEGEGADELPTDGSDMVSRAMRHEEKVCAQTAEPLPPFAMHGVNRIPLQRGLGSSSAAVVAGLLAAATLLDVGRDSSPFSLLIEAAGLEGHPDNAAPALFGGFTIANPGELVPPIRLDPHPDLRPIALVPKTRVATAMARAALKGEVSLGDAAFTGAHAAAVAVGITRDPDVLFTFRALEDRLHQEARLDLAPESRAAFEAIWSSNIPVCVSGAGPSLLAFERPPYELPDLGPGWRVIHLEPDLTGARIV